MMSRIISLATAATFLLLAASPFTNTPILANALSSVIEHCTVPNTVALTFNSGPYLYTEDIIKALNAANAKGTFFVNGNNWDCIYKEDEASRLKLAYDNGHQIASLTWSHMDLASVSSAQINSEMSRKDAVRKITGATPAFTRPPYGIYNDLVIEVANNRNQKLVTWDFESGDSTGVKPEDQKKLFDDIVAKKPSNVLAQMYEVYETTAHEVLPYAIKVLQGAGYKLVTVAECLGENPYLRVDAPSISDGSWNC